MRCEICGKETSRIIDEYCPECYLNMNSPTKVSNIPWILAIPFKIDRKKSKACKEEHQLDMELAYKIVNGEYTIENNNSTIRIGERVVPLTVEAFDDLAVVTGILVGKWFVYQNRSEIDDAWKRIAIAVYYEGLARSAKVSTAFQQSERHVICVYTDNYLDVEEVFAVRDKLKKMGFKERFCYKPDIYTYLDIYSGTTKLSPCRYRK